MRRSLLKRPSPGLVLACVALFVALGGGAYAATSSDNHTDKKIAKKAAKSYFNGHIGGASVSHASTAGSANSANSATNATNATNAQNGYPYSFAHVSAAGVLDIAHSKNAGTVATSSPGSAQYCFTNLPFQPRAGVASVDYADSSNQFAQVGIGVGGACPAGTEAWVGTRLSSGASPAGFYVEWFQ